MRGGVGGGPGGVAGCARRPRAMLVCIRVVPEVVRLLPGWLRSGRRAHSECARGPDQGDIIAAIACTDRISN